MINPLEYPICFSIPHRLTPFSAWHEHIPFAMFLVDILRPKVIVELGTQHGDSYCAFCQAVQVLKLDTRCYAIDTWKGDPHAGFYGPEVLADLRAHHDPLYGDFSCLIQSTFDEALRHFADKTVDLLHIDGYHTYEAVKHDFISWLPKMSSRGVVLLHDINVLERDFGARKFWDEIKYQYPHFEFLHEHGLGVLAVGSELPRAFREFLESSSEEAARIREFFFQLGHRLTLLMRQHDLAKRLAEKDAQLETQREQLTRQITEKEQAIQKLQARLAEKEQAIAQLQMEQERLAQQLAEKEQWGRALQSQIAALYASRSWRITAPLRTTKSFVLSIPKLCQSLYTSLKYWLGWSIHSMRLEPVCDLVQGEKGFISTGNDPQFLLHSSKQRMPCGWAFLTYAVEYTDVPLKPRLYVDSGDGFSELTAIDLPPVIRGRAEAIIRLPNRVRALRLDPTDKVGTFSLSYVTICEVGKLPLALKLLWPRLKAVLSNPRRFGPLCWEVLRLYRCGGLKAVKERLLQLKSAESQDYETWVKLYDTLTDFDRAAIRKRIETLSYRPLFSIIMPVYNTNKKWLRLAIESVRQQLYPYWELCIVDDASTERHIRPILEEYARCDPRIKVLFRARRGNISAASNDALTLATGEFVGFLDHDDELAEHALYCVAEELNAYPDADIIYSDQDKISEEGQRFDPYFKPDFNPDLLRSQNYIDHFLVIRASLVRQLGGLRVGYEGGQDYDLVLRAVELTTPNRIRHIPHVLYHWRAARGSTAWAPGEKPYAPNASRRALIDHLKRCGIEAKVESPLPGLSVHRVIYPLPDPPPLVSVIIPTKDEVGFLRRCVNGVLRQTDYPRLEIIIVDNQSKKAETKAFLNELLKDPRVKIISYDAPFNYSAINNMAVRESSGEVLCFLNNDVEIINPGWLREMVSHAIRPEIGAVGARLYYPNDTVQHAGVFLGYRGLAGHFYRYTPRYWLGHWARGVLIQNVSAVTGACMVVRRCIFEEVGGFDEKNLPIILNDIDLCLRILERGYRNLYTPYAELYHCESVTRGLLAHRFEEDFFKTRWKDLILNDPAYNPNLTWDKEDLSPAFPPRVYKPWHAANLNEQYERS